MLFFFLAHKIYEEKHLNAKLHTDLLNKNEKDKVVSAGKKVKAGVEAIASPNEGGRFNTFKEGLVGIYLNEYIKENQKAFNLLKDKNLSNNQKIQILSNLQEQFYAKHGYRGELPEIQLTDEVKSFAVDKEKSADGKEKIFVSIQQLNDPNFSMATIFGHETGHLNTYDTGEETAKYLESKIETEDLSKQFTAKEKEEYIRSLGNRHLPNLSEKEQYEIAKNIPQEKREHFSKLITFITNSEVAGSPAIVDKEDKNIVKIGNKFYYGDYEIVGMQEWSYGKDKYMLTLDYNSKAPSIGKMSTLMSVAKLVSTITDPTTTILNSKELKNDVKNLLNNEKIVENKPSDAIKQFKNEYNKETIKESLDEWGISSKGTNQGIEHFYNKKSKRIDGLADRLGVPKDDFNASEKGFKNFTSQAKRVVSEATKQGNVISEENGKKMIYYINGADGSREGVKVIIYDGKLQSMMPFRVPLK